MVASPKQVGCISGRNGKIRAAEVLDHCHVYSNHFPVAVKERLARTARCRRGVINDLVLKDVPYMSLCGDGPDKVLRGELRHDDSDVLSTAMRDHHDFERWPGAGLGLELGYKLTATQVRRGCFGYNDLGRQRQDFLDSQPSPGNDLITVSG